jgi:hypothetical protein
LRSIDYFFQPAYGMTEISIVFLTKPEDTLEQMTATVGFPQDHIEVSYKIKIVLFIL